MITVMYVPHGGEVDIQPAGTHDSTVLVRYGENAVELVLHDNLIRQLVAKANAHLERRAANAPAASIRVSIGGGYRSPIATEIGGGAK